MLWRDSSYGEEVFRISAERVLNKPLTLRQRDLLDRLARKPEAEIDVSDIPPLTDEQLAQMVPIASRKPTS